MQTNTATYHLTKEQIITENEQVKAAQIETAKFDVLYDTYYIRIFRFVYQRVETEDIAADISSQVFVNAMLNLKKYKFQGLPFGSWLFRIARNQVNMHFRKESKQRMVYAKTEDLKDLVEEIEENNKEEMLQKLVSALDRLNEKELEMIELRFFEHRSFKEIGELLDITENNSKVRVFRILRKMKKMLT